MSEIEQALRQAGRRPGHGEMQETILIGMPIPESTIQAPSQARSAAWGLSCRELGAWMCPAPPERHSAPGRI